MEFCHRFKMMVNLFIYLLVYIAFNSQGHIATGSLQVEKTSAYCTVNHWALGISYQLSNMKHPAQDSNWWPQRLEARSLTATPPSPLDDGQEKEERRFILRTDHASLKWLVNFKEPVGMLARWLAVLSTYDFETHYCKGAIHSTANGLSRHLESVKEVTVSIVHSKVSTVFVL